MSWKRSISRVVKEFGRSIRTVKVDVFVTSPSGFLSNRTILITGGGRGLGFHIAKKCVMEGATVVLDVYKRQSVMDGDIGFIPAASKENNQTPMSRSFRENRDPFFS